MIIICNAMFFQRACLLNTLRDLVCLDRQISTHAVSPCGASLTAALLVCVMPVCVVVLLMPMPVCRECETLCGVAVQVGLY